MSDTELNNLCAAAMGLTVWKELGGSGYLTVTDDGTGRCQYIYNPLTNDMQVTALVKKFAVAANKYRGAWDISIPLEPQLCDKDDVSGSDIRYGYFARGEYNRAVVEAVAKMQYARQLAKIKAARKNATRK